MVLIAGESQLTFNNFTSTVVFEGSMRLANLTEYEKVSEFLKDSAKSVEKNLILDLSRLNFLNSSGITTLSMFIIGLKKLQVTKLKVIGSHSISWQEKSLPNFNKLWHEVEIAFE